MGLSLACSDGAHHQCLRPRCTCTCGHLFRARTFATPSSEARRRPPSDARFDTAGHRICADCDTRLAKKPGPGRWPLRCDTCKATVARSTAQKHHRLVDHTLEVA